VEDVDVQSQQMKMMDKIISDNERRMRRGFPFTARISYQTLQRVLSRLHTHGQVVTTDEVPNCAVQ
jgi:hypothetical protein